MLNHRWSLCPNWRGGGCFGGGGGSGRFLGIVTFLTGHIYYTQSLGPKLQLPYIKQCFRPMGFDHAPTNMLNTFGWKCFVKIRD